MTAASRAVLKGYFQTNDTPTEAQFASLIDTVVDGEPVTYTVIKVAASGGDFTTLAAAYAAITDNDITKRYIVLVAPGSYIVTDLDMKPYVHLFGAGMDQTTLQNDGTLINTSVIRSPNNCIVANLNLIAVAGARYVMHLDSSNWSGTFLVSNVRAIHRDASNVLGMGGRAGQIMRYESCILNGTVGIHGDPSNGRAPGSRWSIEFVGSSMKTVVIDDFLEYEQNRVLFQGSKVDLIAYQQTTSYYDDNAADTDFNRGFMRESIAIIDGGSNQIGRVTTGGVLRTTPHVLPSITTYAVNTGGSSIAIGEAVKLLADPTYGTNAATEPNNDLPTNNVAKYDGSGIFYGVAVNAMAAGAQGVVQYAGRPQVLADGTGTTIAYGDALELNASGRFVKQSSGRIVAFARAARASGTGLIEAVLA